MYTLSTRQIAWSNVGTADANIKPNSPNVPIVKHTMTTKPTNVEELTPTEIKALILDRIDTVTMCQNDIQLLRQVLSQKTATQEQPEETKQD